MKRVLVYTACGILFLTGCATTSSLMVASDPAGASIYIDGNQVGKTPATLKVKFEQNEQLVTEKKILVLKLQGYQDIKEVLSCDGPAKQTVQFTLQPTNVLTRPTETKTELKSGPSATVASQSHPAESPGNPAANQNQPRK